MTERTPTGWAALDRLLDEALDLELEAREELLQRVEASDPALADQARRILAASETPGGLLDAPASARHARLVSDGATDQPDPLPERIGAYRILREAGHGGMGTVYEAERDDGQFALRVAIKVLREEIASPELIRRFHEERQILARLQHPGIARLLDGGVTDEGTPFYVMELVEGEPITRWCDARRLDIPARLRLFQQACEAVQYAHGNLVVHRDLKPANILVTAAGEVKLLDFGIAKLLSVSPERGSTTAVGYRLLTPEYASPEQLRGEPVGTTSDIFALGLLLHELLTGRRPFPVGGVAAHEIERILRTDQLARPSSLATRQPEPAVSTTGDRATAAELATARSTTPARLRRALHGDLDAILAHALAREPEVRYPTAALLAADIRNHLDGRAVSAHHLTPGYLTRKFIARHRVAVGSAAAVVVLLTGLLLVHTATVARERDAAVQHATRAEEVTTFLVDLFSAPDPFREEGGRPSLEEILASGSRRLEGELLDQPAVRAQLLRTIATVQRSLGNYDEATRLFTTAHEVHRSTLRTGPLEEALGFRDLGVLEAMRGNHSAADSLLHEALILRRRALTDDHPDVAELLSDLAGVRLATRDLDAADTLYRQVLDVYRRTLDPADEALAGTLTAMGILARQRNDLEAAEQYHQEALASRRSRYGDVHPHVAETLMNLALVQHSRGAPAPAAEAYREALAIQLATLGPQHPRVGRTRQSYASLLRTLGDLDEAATQFEQALAMQRSQLGPTHPNLAATISNYAMVLLERGDAADARRLAREGLDMRLALFGPEHPNVAGSYSILAAVLREQRAYREADALLARAQTIYERRLGARHPFVATILSARGLVAQREGRHAAAQSRLRESLAIQREAGVGESVDAATTLQRLGMSLMGAGRAGEAREVLAEAVALLRHHLPHDHRQVLETAALLEQATSADGQALAGIPR